MTMSAIAALARCKARVAEAMLCEARTCPTSRFEYAVSIFMICVEV
ncbi:hypothetical protein ABIA25_005284 [Sinorhizobium fredii]